MSPAAQPAPERPAALPVTPAVAGPPAWDRRDSLTVAALAVAGWLLFAWGAGAYGLWDPFETANAAAAVETAEHGGLVLPRLDGDPDHGRPILHHWALRSSFALFGPSERAARLPSALAGIAGLALLFYCVRRVRGYATALVSAGVLATTPLYFFMARQAMPDMLLTACLTGAMGFFAVARFTGCARRAHLVLFYACTGLAVLAKGPVALAITGSALLVFALLQIDAPGVRDPGESWMSSVRRLASRYELGWGLLILSAIVAPWHVAAAFATGGGLGETWLWSESLRHFNTAVGGEDSTADFHAKTLFHSAYPWIGLAPLALLHLFQGPRRVNEDVRFRGYLIAWAGVVFCLFTLAITKHGFYLLPILPALAVLVALVFESWFADEAPWWVGPALIVSIGFTLLPIRDFLIEGDGDLLAAFADSRDLEHDGLATALKVFLAAWAAAMLFAAARRRSWVALGIVLTVAYGHAVYLSHAVLPAQSEGRNLRAYALLFERIREPDAQLYLYGEPAHSVHFYFGRERFVSFPGDDPEALIERIDGRSHVYIIAEDDELAPLSNALRRTGRWFPIAQDHPGYILLTNSRNAIRNR